MRTWGIRAEHFTGLLVAVVLAIGAVVTTPAAAADPPTRRLDGVDRYFTASVIASNFPPDVPAVYIATGESFPDALAAVPAAIRADAPILLVRRDVVPEVIAARLRGLDPASIVVVGGPGAVSDAVLADLQQYTEGPVTRLAGENRFATAGEVSAGYSPGVPVVYLASGRDFPDALSAGPVAGYRGGPLLLTEPGTLPATTASELDRLDPASIVIVGGPGAVSEAVADGLTQFSPQVSRMAGADRYATSVAVSSSAFGAGTAPTAFLATGFTFPDALAGAALAGQAPGPVLLTRPDCVPESVKAEIGRLAPTGVTLFGGVGALTESVATLTACQAPPSFVTFGDGTYLVGVDIQPGTYRLRTAPTAEFCYWERASSFPDDPNDFEHILGNGTGTYPIVVTIRPTDFGFHSRNCGTWSSDLSPLLPTAPNGPIGHGVWMVGVDMAPGTWTAAGGTGCYWVRLYGFGGHDKIDGGNGDVNPVVTINATDTGFETYNCGPWTQVS